MLGWVGLGWVGLGWVGLGWVGLGWVGLGWVGLGWVGLGLGSRQRRCPTASLILPHRIDWVPPWLSGLTGPQTADDSRTSPGHCVPGGGGGGGVAEEEAAAAAENRPPSGLLVES